MFIERTKKEVVKVVFLVVEHNSAKNLLSRFLVLHFSAHPGTLYSAAAPACRGLPLRTFLVSSSSDEGI